VNLFSKTHIHNVITIKWVPPNLEGNPLEPPRGATNNIYATYITLI
jgi:hypothetical protein